MDSHAPVLDHSRTGRRVGAMILALMVGGLFVNFSVEAPVFRAPGFLTNAAPHATGLAAGALIGVVVEALWLGVAITAFPVVAARSRSLAFWLIALSTVLVAAAIAEGASVMSLVSLSEDYARASGADRNQFTALGHVVGAARNWQHFLSRIADGATIFVFGVTLFRLALVPRPLAAAVSVAALMQVTGVAMPLFGHDVIFPLLAPLGLGLLSLAVWLIVRGFSPRPPPVGPH